MERWQSKVAVVTGASSGIGKAIAESLVKHGMKVVGLARRKDRLLELEEASKGMKGEFFAVQTDVKKLSEILAAFKWIEENLGAVHVVINNAGISGKQQSLEAGETEEWESIINLNLLGLMNVSREGIKSMRKHGIDDGHIINISSVVAYMSTPLPGIAPYCATKKAVSAISNGLRSELTLTKSKIRVTELCPGLVRTEIINNVVIPEHYPILESEDIADSVIYILQTPSRVLISHLTISPTGEKLENASFEKNN